VLDRVDQREDRLALRAAVAPFEKPELWYSVAQIVTSIGFYVVTVGLMYWSISVSYALTVLLSFPAAAFLVRTFIVQHDCGHGSFFVSKRANAVLGALCGVLTLAPYAHWRRQHAGHHAHWNNLDHRQSGADIYSVCLTVAEYRALSPRRRFFYRLWRHPVMANVIFPPLVFLLLYRIPFDTPRTWVRERRSVWMTDIALAFVFGVLVVVFGPVDVVLVHLPIVVVTTIVGVWLFSIQHRFDDARWRRGDEWNFAEAALQGSSHLALPRALHWLTGNIGFHHIHHLSPRVPNYRLAACHNSSAILQPAKPLLLDRALIACWLTLWDEDRAKLVPFRGTKVRNPKNASVQSTDTLHHQSWNGR
jgi:omega-6 fatty acid desaturase (delta-12 desaturase)